MGVPPVMPPVMDPPPGLPPPIPQNFMGDEGLDMEAMRMAISRNITYKKIGDSPGGVVAGSWSGLEPRSFLAVGL